jgi:glycosyltransferase involved in cell wall biosynthesis
MKLLFVHRSFPGQFVHLLHALAADRDHQVVFITRPCEWEIAGVTKVTYAVTPASHRTHADARDFDAAMRHAVAVAEVASGLSAAGFQPDIIIGHEGWGETLNLRDVWPGVPQIGFREYFYHDEGTDVGFDPEFPVHPSQLSGVRAKNATGVLALLQGHQGVSPTEWQRSLYPSWAQPAIRVIQDGIDLATCRPDPASHAAPFRLGAIEVAPDQRLVTFAARDLEPYRGFHTFMRALPAILARSDVQAICLGGDGVSYGLPPLTGTWRGRLLAEIAGRVDLRRLHFPGRTSYTDFIRVLQRSDVHCYLSYPFIASWSLREAMACGCTILAAETAATREFISHDGTGVLVAPLDPGAVARETFALLDDGARRAATGRDARGFAETHLAMAYHLQGWFGLIRDVVMRTAPGDSH